MASESGDPFDGSSPVAFGPTNGPDYEELFVPTEDLDLPMPDAEKSSDQPSPPPTSAPSANDSVPNPSSGALQSDTASDPAILRNEGDYSTEKDGKEANLGEKTSTIPQENGDVDMTDSEKADRIKALLTNSAERSETEGTESENSKSRESSKSPPKDTETGIKKEVIDCEMMDKFISAEVIDLSESEDDLVVIKQERIDSPFRWTNTEENPIPIPDSDDDDRIDFINLDDGTNQAIKQEDPDVEFVWSSMGDRVIDLDANEELPRARAPNLGMSFLGRRKPRAQLTPAARELLLQRQRMFANVSLGKAGNPGPTRAGPHPHPHKRPSLGDDDNDSWMSGDYNTDEDAAIKFRDLKRSYKVKKKAGTNTVEDDIEIEKARKTEEVRLKRLEREYLNSRGLADDDDSSEEEDETLFVAPSPSRGTKRHRARNAADEDGIDSVPATQKRRQNPRRSRKAEQAAIEKDLELSLQAGLEGFFRKEMQDFDKAEDDAAKKGGKKAGRKPGKGEKNTKAQKNPTGKGKMGWGKELQKGKLKPRKKKPTEVGYLNNAGSLLTGNVFEYAKANNNLTPLPFTTQRNKQASLAAMVEGLPKGHRFRAEKEHIRRSTVTLGNKRVVPDGKGGWSLPKMISSLRHHQVQGSAWMMDRELQSEEPLGGILADGKHDLFFTPPARALGKQTKLDVAHRLSHGQEADRKNLPGMGLGKTIQTLALMTSNPPTRDDEFKATLIVCTPALLSQWEREIAKHSTDKAFRRVMKHRAGERVGGKGAIEDMQNASIVLTTYQEVMKSYPKSEVPEEVDTSEKLQDWWKGVWTEDRDILHKARFFRIVLDESQAIKNHLSQTSIACRALSGTHRWALSGTPIMNRVEELYPYFKFLRVECTGAFPEFTQHFCVEGSSDCNKRLHCVLDQIMVRRTMDDKVLGHPIVSLPDTHQATERLNFNIVERYIYKIVSRRYIRAINKASKSGELEKRPSCGIVMFLRLRQMAAHIFLIQEILQDLFELDSVARLEAATVPVETANNKSGRDIIAALRRMVAAKGTVQETTPDRQSEVREENPGELVVRLRNRLQQLKEAAKMEELKNEQLCHKCESIPDEPWVTSCLHVYCKECLEFMAYEASKADKDKTPCRECETVFTGSQPCSGLKELVIDEFADLFPDLKGRKKNNGKVNMHWVSYEDQLVLSAKTMGVQAQIEKWLGEDPDKKIIVFSQFHMIMQILEKVCQKQNWGYCNYHGKMSHQARDKTIQTFEKNKGIKIMIASLKCGGIGLNLTMASRVTCVDLWFNSCMEQQAFCRVWRIGQTDETFVTRFIVSDTVDDRLEEMQKHKEKIVGAAMDDRSITSKLSPQEVMRLFGEVQIDKITNKPFIALDDDEKLDAILPPVDDDADDHIAWRK